MMADMGGRAAEKFSLCPSDALKFNRVQTRCDFPAPAVFALKNSYVRD